jgi:hypothetical protein
VATMRHIGTEHARESGRGPTCNTCIANHTSPRGTPGPTGRVGPGTDGAGEPERAAGEPERAAGELERAAGEPERAEAAQTLKRNSTTSPSCIT